MIGLAEMAAEKRGEGLTERLAELNCFDFSKQTHVTVSFAISVSSSLPAGKDNSVPQ